MAIDSLFERGTLHDWREFTQALKDDSALARNTLVMCERHSDKGSAALARTLIQHFHPDIDPRRH
jgi:hypothetical protein